MSDLGRILIGIGLLLVVCGVAILLLGKAGLPMGRLPGDLTWHTRHTRFYFPLGTSILISAVLSLVFWLLALLRR
jgi:hypothetical protein